MVLFLLRFPHNKEVSKMKHFEEMLKTEINAMDYEQLSVLLLNLLLAEESGKNKKVDTHLAFSQIIFAGLDEDIRNSIIKLGGLSAMCNIEARELLSMQSHRYKTNNVNDSNFQRKNKVKVALLDSLIYREFPPCFDRG